MEHLVFARDLYFKIVKKDKSIYLRFCIGNDSRFRDLLNNETVYHTEKYPLIKVWSENKNGDFNLNLPEEFDLDNKTFPKFLDKKSYTSLKLDINELINFENECNQKLNSEYRIYALPSKANDLISQYNLLAENLQNNENKLNAIEF